MKVFQYLAIYRATPEEKKNGKKDKIIVEMKTVLASDQNAATLLAARAISAEYADMIDQVEVVVRPF